MKNTRLNTVLAMLLVVALCLSIVPVIAMAADTRTSDEEIQFSSVTRDKPAEEEEGDIHIPIGSLPTNPTEPSAPTEPSVPAAKPGDMTGDDELTNVDVVALMWNILFPEQYPLNVETDLNKDGSRTNDDVVTLMWHVLFPEQYPLP